MEMNPENLDNQWIFSEEFLNKIINSVPDPIFVKDEDHKWIILNDSYCKFMGYPREELIGKSDPDFFPEDQAQIFWKYDELVFQSGIQNVNEEFFTDAKGEVHVISTKKSVFTDQITGKKVLVGIIRDITERKKTEEALRMSREMLQLVIDNVPQHIFWKNKDSVFLGCDKGFAKLVGLENSEDIIGKTDYDLCSGEEAHEFRETDKMVIDSNTGYYNKIETRILPEGQQIYLESSKIPIHDIDGKVIGILGTYQDITERKKLEEELLKAKKFESIGILAGGIAHDFNNLLSIIIGSISLAEMVSENNPELSRILKRAEDACDKAKGLIKDFIPFSRGGVPVKKVTSIENIIVNSSFFVLKDLPVKQEISIADDLYMTEIDEDQIQRVIHNIILNAKEAVNKDGVIKISAQNVTIKNSPTLKSGEYIKISIEDNGYGIPEENINKIFDPYFTTKPMSSQKGTGLGLAICYAIIKKHDGLITLESTLGKGTTFHIYLKAYNPPE